MTNRIVSLDILKGIAIFLVVYGHCLLLWGGKGTQLVEKIGRYTLNIYWLQVIILETVLGNLYHGSLNQFFLLFFSLVLVFVFYQFSVIIQGSSSLSFFLFGKR